MNIFEKLKNGLKKTRDAIAYSLSAEKLDDDFFDELEESLILADAGADVASEVIERLREAVGQNHVTDPGEAVALLRDIVAELLRPERPLDFSGTPAVVLLIGVNGAGKTTTTGKLANLFKNSGKTVLIAAADTFRAAATEQLEVWAERSGSPLIKGAGDPSAVVFDAVAAAKARGIDMVLADTAGRLHTKKNLMEELGKMARIVKKAAETASIEAFLVLDAVTGQNAINQAAQFADAAGVTGIVLTKLDGTAKGGAVIAIKQKLGIPVRFIGVGEGIDDLLAFDPAGFAEALFPSEAQRDD